MLKFLLPDDFIRGGVISADIGLNFKMREPLGKAHLIYSDTQKCFAGRVSRRNNSFYLIPREESCANIPRLSYVNNDNKQVKNCLSKL